MSDFSLVFVIANLILYYKICKNDKVHILLKILWGVSYIGWNAIPAVLMYIPSMLGTFFSVSDSYIICSYYNQIFLFLSYSLAYYLITHRKSPKFVSRSDFQDSPIVFRSLLYISIVLSLYELFRLSTSSSFYYDVNNIDNIHALGPIDILASFGVSFVMGAIFLFKEKMSNFIFQTCLTIVCLLMVVHVLRGGRIYLFGIVIIALYYSIIQKRRSILLLSIVLGVFSFALLPALSILRGENRISVSDAVSLSQSATGNSVLSEIMGKTNSVYYGAFLIHQDGIGNHGFQMYTSTVYALIPRFVYPSKPEPGSIDGTQEGLASRRSAVYEMSGSYNGIQNNGVPASLSSLWGGGWLAYFLEIISTAYLLFLINSIFFSGKFIFMCFVINMITFPMCIMEVPLPMVLINIQRYFIIYLLFSLILKRSKSYR